MTDSEIDACREAVMVAYLWLARMKSSDPTRNAQYGYLRIDMEKVRDRFEELFP